jgi:hypothetical protein
LCQVQPKNQKLRCRFLKQISPFVFAFNFPLLKCVHFPIFEAPGSDASTIEKLPHFNILELDFIGEFAENGPPYGLMKRHHIQGIDQAGGMQDHFTLD